MDKHLLVLELEYAPGRGDVQVVVSLPGREGTLTRSWKGSAAGTLSVPQLDDINTWVSQTVQNWMLTNWGVQGALWG